MPSAHSDQRRRRLPSPGRSAQAERTSGRPGAPGVVAPPAVVEPGRLTAVRATGLLDAAPSEAFDRLTRLATRVAGAPVALLSLVDADREFFLSVVDGETRWADRRETPLSAAFGAHVIQRGGPLLVDDARESALLAGNTAVADGDVVAYAGVPLTSADGELLGALCAIDVQPRAWDANVVAALADLAAVATAEIERIELARRLERDVRTDALTGLGNALAWEELAPREIARARRFGQPLVLALIDLDRGRRTGTRRGAPEGDALLRQVAGQWSDALREVDILLRLGGDQFALLMPATGLDPAFDVVDRLRHHLTGGTTCSAGLAMLREGEDAAALLTRADGALFGARRAGRNASTLAA